MHSSLFHFLFSCSSGRAQAYLHISPTAEEIYAAMGIPMEGFFDGVDMVAKAMATAAPVAT